MFAERIEKFFWGNPVEGRVAAVLPPFNKKGSRYILETAEGLLEVQMPRWSCDRFYFTVPMFQPQAKKGQEIKGFATSVRPWVDGQRI